MKRLVGISICSLQEKYGDRRAIEIVSEIGADSADFSLEFDRNDYRNEECVYAKGDEAVREYYSGLKEYADSLGIIIGQTHGKLPGIKNIKDEDDALVENSRLDCISKDNVRLDLLQHGFVFHVEQKICNRVHTMA